MQPFNFSLLLYVLLKFHFALLMLMGSMAEIFSFHIYIYVQGIFPYDIHDDIVYVVLMIQI